MMTYYGGYRTRTFADIFPTADTFTTEISKIGTECGAGAIVPSGASLRQIYYLLYARYGNSHIAYSDENQFIYGVFSTIYMYGANWQKHLDIQQKLRGMTENDLLAGSRAIYNKAFNPNTSPSTDTLEELVTINEQNTTNYKRSKLDGYAALLALLQSDLTADFIAKFNKLFIKVVAPDYPLLYATYPTTNNEEEELSL